jgi:hypothetical protein
MVYIIIIIFSINVTFPNIMSTTSYCKLPNSFQHKIAWKEKQFPRWQNALKKRPRFKPALTQVSGWYLHLFEWGLLVTILIPKNVRFELGEGPDLV